MPRKKSQGREIMPEVPVNAKVLAWAREIRGLDVEGAARLLGISTDELCTYESGGKKPLVGFLRLMSSKYQINFGSLLMPEPLPRETPPIDHRERLGRRPLSMDTLLAIEEISEALELFQDIASEIPKIIPRLHIGEAQLDEDVEAVAARERRKFGVSIEDQRAWRSPDEARRRWRERIEDRGIFTYMISMQAYKELSGFSMLRENVAAICVNDREPTEGAKIFTLFHEYCHLLLRQTGVSDENNEDKVERFCNRFAASFLIPRKALIEAIGDIETPHEFSDADVRRLATRFRVSNRAMAMRLEETGLSPAGFYFKRTAPWDIPRPPEVEIVSERHPSYLRLRVKRIGKLHAGTVLEALKRHAINSFDASELMGLQPSSFAKVEKAIG